MDRVLWIVQGLLAALVLFAGGVKLAMPVDDLGAQSGLPGALPQVVAVAEVLGAIGLILPGLLRIRPGLSPPAAAGFVIIMLGATVLTAAGMGGGDTVQALFPPAVGLLAAFVAYGRRQPMPRHGSSRPSVLQSAG